MDAFDRYGAELVRARRQRRLAHSGEPSSNRRPKRPSRHHALATFGAVCALAAVVTALTLAGTQPQAAFAGWSPTPGHGSRSQLKIAEVQCAIHALASHRPLAGAAEEGSVERVARQVAPDTREPQPMPQVSPHEWHTVLTDTRGPFTTVILTAREGHATASCLEGPAPPGVRSSASRNDAYLLSATGSLEHQPRRHLRAGQVEVWHSEIARTASDVPNGNMYSQIDGRVSAEASTVTLVLQGGAKVQATVMNGWFLAWWPGSRHATSAEITTSSGRTIQRPAR